MTTILEKFKLRPVQVFIPKGLDDHPFEIKSEQIIGIEVEVENVQHEINIPKSSPWVHTSDNSLRNNGAEFVTKPIPANTAPGVLAQLLNKILVQECHFSPRTSVHVHVNAQDMALHQVIDLVLVYSIFEKLLYRFAGRGRVRNIFCVPITETNLCSKMIESSLAWEKYTGLNLCPLYQARDDVSAYGTMEFRQMHGTFSVDKLCLWIDLLVHLKEFIMKSDTKNIRRMIIGMDDSFNFDALTREVFGPNAGVLKFCGLEELREGYLVAKEALVGGRNTTKMYSSASDEARFFKFKG